MEKSKVYFTDMHTYNSISLPDKLKKLIQKAGIGAIDMEDKFVAIKIHFGEPGNLAFLRPNFAKAVVDIVKTQRGLPFLTDCNTLYVGRRKNALEHIDAAYENGFSPFSTGCNVIIADGLKGTDEVEVPVEGGELVKRAKIGRAIMDADVFLSLSHFKGHEATGFGGAIKNIGMGCGSRAGKMEQHCNGKPSIDKELCRSCKACAKQCAHSAISFDGAKKASIDMNRCVGCGRCIGHCNFNAISNSEDSSCRDLNMKMAEYTKAVLHGRPHFHICIVMDVSPYCDCHAENDMPIIPNVGMFASFDPVALDKACADACNAQIPLPGSKLEEGLKHHPCQGKDHFYHVSPNTEWKSCLEHAQKLGIGTLAYELITVK